MSKNSSTTSSGVGIGGLVFVAFLVLKLAEIGVVAKWSWWWVTAPIWMPITLAFIGFVIYLFVSLIKHLIK